jgi:hypothetical protein
MERCRVGVCDYTPASEALKLKVDHDILAARLSGGPAGERVERAKESDSCKGRWDADVIR